jgi:hypothetical protein
MIKVYFETQRWGAEHIATFYDERVYMLALPALEKWAESIDGFITESVIEEERL